MKIEVKTMIKIESPHFDGFDLSLFCDGMLVTIMMGPNSS
jgi:hypothetical protein